MGPEDPLNLRRGWSNLIRRRRHCGCGISPPTTPAVSAPTSTSAPGPGRARASCRPLHVPGTTALTAGRRTRHARRAGGGRHERDVGDGGDASARLERHRGVEPGASRRWAWRTRSATSASSRHAA